MARYFNKNLKFIRQSKKISQQELADKLGLDRSTISRWENDEMDITVGNAIKIANYFNIPMEEFSGMDLTKNSFANRLNQAIELNNITPTEFANKVDTDESIINSCLDGKYKPNSMNLQRFAATLNVSDKWLKGEDVDINGNSNQDEIEILYSKNKNILTDSDKTIIKTIIEQRIKENGE